MKPEERADKNFITFLKYLESVTHDYKAINIIDPIDQKLREKLVSKLLKSDKILNPQKAFVM